MYCCKMNFPRGRGVNLNVLKRCIKILLFILILFIGFNFVFYSNSMKIQAKGQIKIKEIKDIISRDPFEFTVVKSIDLINSKFDQDINNPFKQGLSINTGWNWGQDFWQRIGLEYADNKGITYSLAHVNIDSKQKVNNIEYEMKENREKIGISYQFKTHWQIKGEVHYKENRLFIISFWYERRSFILREYRGRTEI